MDTSGCAPLLSSALMDGSESTIYVFRPDPWPSSPLPLLVFTNGQGQFADKYEHIFEPLVRDGFVVASVQSPSASETARRRTLMACTLRWIRLKWAEASNQRLNCDLAFAGHSRGGEAAWDLTNQRDDIFWSDINPDGFDFQLKALVGIAPRHEGPGEIALARAVPYLGLLGSTDEDVGADAVTAYDQISREEALTAGITHTKAVVWAYDVPHGAFGGKAQIVVPQDAILSGPEYGAKGQALAAGYVVPFLRWHVADADPAAHRRLFTGEAVPDGMDPLEPDITTPAWWSYMQPMYNEVGQQPLVLTTFAAANGIDGEARFPVDLFSSRQTFTTTLPPQQIAIGDQAAVTDPLLDADLPHDSELLLIRWGGMEPGGILEWELDGADAMDLSNMHHLSLRVGQQTAANMPANMCFNDPIAVESEAVDIELSLEDAQGIIATVPSGPLIQQDRRAAEKLDNLMCFGTQYMRTLRVPMTAFCAEPGFDPSQVRFVRIILPDTPRASALYFDTIEFTHSPTLDAGAACG